MIVIIIGNMPTNTNFDIINELHSKSHKIAIKFNEDVLISPLEVILEGIEGNYIDKLNSITLAKGFGVDVNLGLEILKNYYIVVEDVLDSEETIIGYIKPFTGKFENIKVKFYLYDKSEFIADSVIEVGFN